jgi:thioredoxin reductase (NADPH)
VTMLVRGDSLARSMSSYLIEQIEARPAIEVRTNTQVTAARGDGHLDELEVSGPDGAERLDATAMFVFIGAEPHTEWVGDRVGRDERGFVLAGPDLAALDGQVRWPLERDPFLLETSLPGVFVAGVQFIHQYLADT